MADLFKSDFNLVNVQTGTWFIIHRWAITSKDRNDRMAYCMFINFLTLQFICEECRLHIKDFVKKNPPERYIDSADNLFRWSWELHCNATFYANKKRPMDDQHPSPTLQEAKLFWETEQHCSDCEVESFEAMTARLEANQVYIQQANQSFNQVPGHMTNQMTNQMANQVTDLRTTHIFSTPDGEKLIEIDRIKTGPAIKSRRNRRTVI